MDYSWYLVNVKDESSPRNDLEGKWEMGMKKEALENIDQISFNRRTV